MIHKISKMKIASHELDELKYAKSLLENPSLAAKLSDLLAIPIEKGFALLPAKWSSIVNFATKKSLENALDFALNTISKKRSVKKSAVYHKIAVAATGFSGGAFGLSSVPIELPVSTLIMLRSIADIARSEGEDLSQPEAKLNCLQVFALGGRTKMDDSSETGYYAIRLSLSKIVSDAARHIAERGLTKKSAPVLVRFISIIASRFGTVVSEKIAAMAIPAIGAVGGGLVNTLFIEHFQNMARGHFIVRRLERKYGVEMIKKKYLEL